MSIVKHEPSQAKTPMDRMDIAANPVSSQGLSPGPIAAQTPVAARRKMGPAQRRAPHAKHDAQDDSSGCVDAGGREASPAAYLCRGSVGHKRLRPRRHALAYDVCAVLVDVDRLEAVAAGSRWFAHNRFNLFALYDRDYGVGDGTPLAAHTRQRLADAGLAAAGHRIRLLTYPRWLGYAFNPISVYFCEDAAGELAALIYEVNNTRGGRFSYVVAAGAGSDGVYAQAHAKAMIVSPFTARAGSYGFRVRRPDPACGVLVAVALRDAQGPLLKTWFRARLSAFDDRSLLRAAAAYPLMTLKVTAAIHLEALRLWWKGVPVVWRTAAPAQDKV